LRGLGAGPQRAFRLAVLAAALYGALADIWICGLRAFP
jgi:hypothetical protein